MINHKYIYKACSGGCIGIVWLNQIMIDSDKLERNMKLLDLMYKVPFCKDNTQSG